MTDFPIDFKYRYLTEKKKKDKTVQHESCELSSIWGKMTTMAQKTASQLALGTCSEELEGDVRII